MMVRWWSGGGGCVVGVVVVVVVAIAWWCMVEDVDVGCDGIRALASSCGL